MRLPLFTAPIAALLALSLLGTAPSPIVTAVGVAPDGSSVPQLRVEEAAQADGPLRIKRPLQGLVMTWEDGRAVRLAGAHVGTGERSVQTDRHGRFSIPAAIRTNQVNVVAAGYRIVRQQTTADYIVIYVAPLDVRAIYVPYDELRRQAVLDWALGLVRAGIVSSLVIDVKDEGGAVLPMVANDIARDMGAVRDTGTDLEAFFNELGRLGIHRIARVVTFLDGRLARAYPETAVRTPQGEIFRDSIGLAWTDPFSDLARRHNVEIGVNAARTFEEVQYDYVRLPTDAGAAVRIGTTSDERSAIIAQFAQEAAQALHAVGAALAFDTFGQTTVIAHDDGIGQILEDMAPYLDYYSPMVYPSTWTPGWFGLDYPPADPYLVVLSSVSLAVERLRPFPNVVVRPWLQDFHDYQAEKLFYGRAQVMAQIEGSAEAGGQGFMLWDPSLNYQMEVLADLEPQPPGGG